MYRENYCKVMQLDDHRRREKNLRISRMATVHPDTIVGNNVVIDEDVMIPEPGVFIGNFVHIRERALVEAKVGIRSHCLLDPEVIVGAGTQIYPHATVGGGTRIGKEVYYGPYTLTTNSRDPGVIEPPRIRDHATVYAGCMIGPGVTIGEGAILGMGSVLTRSIPPYELWFGSPARFIKALERKPLWPYSMKDIE